jgi:hypothetical protein
MEATFEFWLVRHGVTVSMQGGGEEGGVQTQLLRPILFCWMSHCGGSPSLVTLRLESPCADSQSLTGIPCTYMCGNEGPARVEHVGPYGNRHIAHRAI